MRCVKLCILIDILSIFILWIVYVVIGNRNDNFYYFDMVLGFGFGIGILVYFIVCNEKFWN